MKMLRVLLLTSAVFATVQAQPSISTLVAERLNQIIRSPSTLTFLPWVSRAQNITNTIKADTPTATNTAANSKLNDAVNTSDPGKCNDLVCLCPFFLGKLEQNGTCRLSNGEILKPALRKEYRRLTDGERIRFHAAMIQLKKSGEYDILKKMHSREDVLPVAHGGPAFMPWHREFLKRVEIKLRLVDPSVALPYWYSVLDENLPYSRDSILWSDGFFGTTDEFDNVVSGPFSGWCTNTNCSEQITRRIGCGQLINQTELEHVLNQTAIENVLSYADAKDDCPHEYTCKDKQCLEEIHGNVHGWMGGHMMNVSISANDPVFFIHHTFVDYVWEMWRQKYQTREERETAYPSDHLSCSIANHFKESEMLPFPGVRNIDALSNKYTDNMYRYEPLPSCTSQKPDCGSNYLFCDRSHDAPRCASKVRLGGRCHDFEKEDICYRSSCVNGRCVKK